MKKLLLLDHRSLRLQELARSIEKLHRFDVVARLNIGQDEFERSKFDIVIAHQNNPESFLIEDHWDRDGARLILFSGSFALDHETYGDIEYVCVEFLQSDLNNLLGK
jgi:hypothetical protein